MKLTTPAQHFNDADLAWHHALLATHGADARYHNTGKGDPGTALRAAYDARTAAFAAWQASRGTA